MTKTVLGELGWWGGEGRSVDLVPFEVLLVLVMVEVGDQPALATSWFLYDAVAALLHR